MPLNNINNDTQSRQGHMGVVGCNNFSFLVFFPVKRSVFVINYLREANDVN